MKLRHLRDRGSLHVDVILAILGMALVLVVPCRVLAQGDDVQAQLEAFQYETGFEQPTFEPGPVHYQDHWSSGGHSNHKSYGWGPEQWNKSFGTTGQKGAYISTTDLPSPSDAQRVELLGSEAPKLDPEKPGSWRLLTTQRFFYNHLPAVVEVESPDEIAGIYRGAESQNFEPPPNTPPDDANNCFDPPNPRLADTGPISARIVETKPERACEPVVNTDEVTGSIALIQRGDCSFEVKHQNAQAAGALGVIIYNNQDTGVLGMCGDGTGIDIPSLFIDRPDGELIAGVDGPVSGTLKLMPPEDPYGPGTTVAELFELGVTVAETSVDAQLDGPWTAGDLVSANFVQVIPTNFKPEFPLGFCLTSDGYVWNCGSGPYEPIAPADVGQFHRLGLRADYAAGIGQVFVNGDLAGTYAIHSGIEPEWFFGGVELELVTTVGDDSCLYNAYFDNLSVHVYKPFPLDIKPAGCPNPLNTKSKGVLPVAILGTDSLDVQEIDPATVSLVPAQGGAGIPPLRWSIEDVATPSAPYIGKESADDCNELGPDGYLDLTLKFDTQAIAAQLVELNGQPEKLFTVYGKLKEEHGGTPIIGEDVVRLK